jgi:hypothetical protein
MKKSQILGMTALAGSMAVMIPQTASAVVTCTPATSASTTTSCSGGGDDGSYTAEPISFTGSKGVIIDAADSSADFSACAYHYSGAKSFGMTTSATTMVVRDATGKTASSGVGCTS